MKTLLDVMSLNVQVLQVAAYMWMVFEVRFLRRVYEAHMDQYHGQKRRATDGKDNEPTI